jgi:hypothetical protein
MGVLLSTMQDFKPRPVVASTSNSLSTLVLSLLGKDGPAVTGKAHAVVTSQFCNLQRPVGAQLSIHASPGKGYTE